MNVSVESVQFQGLDLLALAGPLVIHPTHVILERSFARCKDERRRIFKAAGLKRLCQSLYGMSVVVLGDEQSQNLDTLETIFEYNRDRNRIRSLRLQVQDYECRVELRAQKLEQMRRLGEEIEGLE